MFVDNFHNSKHTLECHSFFGWLYPVDFHPSGWYRCTPSLSGTKPKQLVKKLNVNDSSRIFMLLYNFLNNSIRSHFLTNVQVKSFIKEKECLRLRTNAVWLPRILPQISSRILQFWVPAQTTFIYLVQIYYGSDILLLKQSVLRHPDSLNAMQLFIAYQLQAWFVSLSMHHETW